MPRTIEIPDVKLVVEKVAEEVRANFKEPFRWADSKDKVKLEDNGTLFSENPKQRKGISFRIRELFPPEKLSELGVHIAADTPSGKKAAEARFYEVIAAEVRRRMLEGELSVTLPMLRATSYDEPPVTYVSGEKFEGFLPEIKNYVGSDSVSVVGPIAFRARIEGTDGFVIPNGNIFIPHSSNRRGVTDGISSGARMLSKLRTSTDNRFGVIDVVIGGKTVVNRASTIRFDTESDAGLAAALVSKETTLYALRERLAKEINDTRFSLIGLDPIVQKVRGHYELAINLTYNSTGSLFGHEYATKAADPLMQKVILPLLEEAKLQHKYFWGAGADLDLKQSPKNFRGRKLEGRVSLPTKFLIDELGFESREHFEEMHHSKYQHWVNYNKALSHSGMEPEVIASIFNAIRPPSPPILSAQVNVNVVMKKGEDGVHYIFTARNLEWGLEGIRTQLRTEVESIMGVTQDKDSNLNPVRVGAAVAAASIAAGINQHKLAAKHSLSATKT